MSVVEAPSIVETWGDISEVEVELTHVSPETASTWLEANQGNRKFGPGTYNRLTGNIATGGWRLTGDAIAFDRDGRLLSGQHRLTYIATGEIGTVPCLVVTGLPIESRDAMDRVRPRNFRDMLYQTGEKDPENLAASVRILAQYETYGTMPHNSGGAGIPEATLSQYLADHPDLRVAVTRSGSLFCLGLSRSLTAALYYLFWQATSKADAERFFTLLREPSGARQDAAVELLRRRLSDDLELRLRGGRAARLDEVVKRAFVIISFNKWMNGQMPRLLAWRPGGANGQPFPSVEGYAPPGSIWAREAEEQKRAIRTRK